MTQIDEVLMALRRVIRATDMHSKHLSKTAGLTAPQLLVLQTLDRHGEVTIGEIAKAISLGQATVTTIITRLENRGSVTREKSQQDRRKVFVTLTPEGKQLLARAPTPLQQKFVTQFAGLESWEQSMILSSLQRVATMMDANDIDASPFLDVGDLDRGNNDWET
ncbi:MAG: MarR family winged helix-turn-helix transcriptional regulator [Porticoccaceae bacterium]